MARALLPFSDGHAAEKMLRWIWLLLPCERGGFALAQVLVTRKRFVSSEETTIAEAGDKCPVIAWEKNTWLDVKL